MRLCGFWPKFNIHGTTNFNVCWVLVLNHSIFDPYPCTVNVEHVASINLLGLKLQIRFFIDSRGHDIFRKARGGLSMFYLFLANFCP